MSRPEAAIAITKVADLEAGFGERLAHSPDGKTWVAAGSGRLNVWSDIELQFSADLPVEARGPVLFGVRAEKLFIGGAVYDLEAREWSELPRLAEGLIQGLESRPRGDFALHAATWSDDGMELLVYTEYRPPRGRGARDSYDGPRKRLLLLDGPTQQLSRILWEADTWESLPTIAIGSKYLAAGGRTILAWSRESGAKLAHLQGHEASTRELRFRSDSDLLASAGADGLVILWDLSGPEPEATRWRAHDDEARALAFHPTRPVLATGGRDHRLRLWSLVGSLLAEASTAGPVEGLSFSTAGDQLVAAVGAPDERLLVFESA